MDSSPIQEENMALENMAATRQRGNIASQHLSAVCPDIQKLTIVGLSWVELSLVAFSRVGNCGQIWAVIVSELGPIRMEQTAGTEGQESPVDLDSN